MSDFIREVNEEYRRDRLIQAFKRWQVPLALFAVAIVAGAGGWRWWMDRQVSDAEAANVRFEQAMSAATSGGATGAAAFAPIIKEGPAGYAMLARMRAAEALQASDPEGAAKAFDDVANDGALPDSLRDTARFRGALIRVDHADAKAFIERYGRFSSPGFAYHDSMEELLALAALKQGDTAAAGRYLDDIIIDGGAPAALRNRAQAFRLLVNAGAATPMASAAPPATITPVAAAAPAPAAPSPAAAPPAPSPPASAPK